ncbi:MAG: hypothetical protein GXO24_03850, partial [Chlorobi bacterium]|nr:hypothetical protein [Chlorobiota bacterium]
MTRRLFPYLLSRSKVFLWFWWIWGFVYAQTPVSQNLEVRWDSLCPCEASVVQTFYFDRPSAGHLALYDWLDAYASIHSSVGKILAERYRLDFHFSTKKQRGFLRIDTSDTSWKIKRRGGTVVLSWDTPKDSLTIRYRIRLPARKFTGMGYDKDGYDLMNVFLQPVPSYATGRQARYHDILLFDRPVMPVRTRIRLYSPAEEWTWQANAEIRPADNGMTEIAKDNNALHLAARRELFHVFKLENHTWILDPASYKSYSDTEKALALDRVYAYLKSRNFPVARKIMITRLDLENFPVYDVNWLPVIKPFPRDFRLSVQLLYQTVRQSMAEWPGDFRRDYAFRTGWEQYLVMQFVETHYPYMRMTGMPVRWPVIRSYRMFEVPYRQKYYLLYRYIARLNYDQALALPADSLSVYNRSVGTPSKALLGWHTLNMYAPGLPDTVWREIYRHADRQVLTPQLFDSLWRQKGGPDISFMWDDFYRTARKIDFRASKIKRRGETFLRIRNNGGMSFPVTVEGKDGPVMFGGRDTLMPWPDQTRRAEINRTELYPEINLRNNTAPAWRKPLRIRFWQDLESPFHRQIFLNPELNYNLYDGLILGVGINNKTFIDKHFMWQLRPSYAFRSRSLTGQADFRYIKRYVRPRLFGWSAGAYAKAYHYDFGRWYRTASVFATLSYKDRARKFMRGHDWSAEYLFVDKETAGPPGETTRYGVAMLSHKWEVRGLLRRYAWESNVRFHRLFVRLESSFRFRSFLDKYRQIECRTYAAWMPYNRTETDYFSMAFTHPTDYLFKYPYYGRSETSGLFYQQYVYAEGGFKVFYPHRFVNRWMLANNVNIGIYKRLNLFADFGWGASYGQKPVFHYDTGLRFYLVPDYFEFYFPLYSDLGP